MVGTGDVRGISERLINELGINSTYYGYRFLHYAILLAVRDSSYLLSITTGLYPAIAEKYNTSVYSVERNIRTVVTACWEYGNRDLLKQISSYPLNLRPTTGEFIDIIVTYCRQNGIEG